MKNKVKFFGIIVIILFITFYLIYSLWANSVLKNLTQQQETVNSKWSELFEYSAIRNNYIRDLAKLKNRDSLIVVVNKNIKERNSYKKENSLEFVKLEHDVNEEFLRFQSSEIDSVKYKQLIENQNKLNSLANEYNDMVLTFNKNTAIFPNFIIAKKNNIKTKVFFEMTYGKNNEDPIEKAGEVPDWMTELENQKGISD